MPWCRGGRCAGRRDAIVIGRVDARTIRQFGEAGRHDGFIGFEPGGDDHLFVVLLSGRHISDRYFVAVKHIDEGALRSPLQGRDGNDDGLFQGLDPQPHIDETAGQRLSFGFGKTAFRRTVPVV